MTEKKLQPAQILELLQSNPQKIQQLVGGVSLAKLHARPEPQEWSMNEILAHLRSCGDVWGDCIRIILSEDQPTIVATNPTTWIKRTNYPEIPFDQSLVDYLSQREALLKVLLPLPESDWERKAVVTVSGKPFIRTVHFYASWLATHERSHLRPIKKTLAAVGS